MGLRLFSEFKSSNGKQYKIEIHQTGFVGTTTSFNVAEDGFKLEYSGETDDIVSPIIGSKCVVSAYNNVGAFDTFLHNVLVRQDDQFFMKILLHDGVGHNDTFWCGNHYARFDDRQRRFQTAHRGNHGDGWNRCFGKFRIHGNWIHNPSKRYI